MPDESHTPREPLLIERTGHVETWTLNLPEQSNPITGPDMVESLVQATANANADHTVRCVVLTGAGSVFSGGGNIKEIRAGTGVFGAPPYGAAEGYRSGIQRLATAAFRCEVPVIAAVNGPAVGAGCDLTLMCDIRIASETATFAENFVQLGLIPGDGGAWLLPRAIGRSRACEMIFTGDRIDAQTALEWGLISRIVPAGELLNEATGLATRIAANPTPAARMAKRLMHQGEHQRFEEALELAATTQSIAHHTDDHHTAVRGSGEEYRGC